MPKSKNLVGEMKDSLEELTSRVTTFEDRFSELEDKVQITFREQQMAKKPQSKLTYNKRTLG